MKKLNQIGFYIIIISIFSVLVYKAITFPVSNDEFPTAIVYHNYSVWEIMMYTDHQPNNHILNTLLTKFFIAIFGNEPLVIRLPNLLAFLVFAFAIFKINKQVLKEESVFFLPATLFFVTNPYLLDFFGLCRGYGISSALATLSVSFLIDGYYNSRTQSVWIAYFISILASYANFTLLVFWCAISLFIWFYHLLKYNFKIRPLIKPTIIIGIVTILYLLLIANPIIKMQSTNEFKYWTSNGFYWDTIYQLIEYSRTGSFLWFLSSHIFSAIIFLTIIINGIYIFRQLKKIELQLDDFKTPYFYNNFCFAFDSSYQYFSMQNIKNTKFTRTHSFILLSLIYYCFCLFSWINSKKQENFFTNNCCFMFYIHMYIPCSKWIQN